MTKLCQECHHAPSCRVAEYGAHCYCKCHDVADAAPDLLVSLKEMVAGLLATASLGLNDEEVARLKRAEAAIAKAEKE